MVIRALKNKKNLLHFYDFDLFIVCCLRRDALEKSGSREDWLELATEYQIAKGAKQSIMANYCMRKAGIDLTPVTEEVEEVVEQEEVEPVAESVAEPITVHRNLFGSKLFPRK
jgi:hypothetical protein